METEQDSSLSHSNISYSTQASLNTQNQTKNDQKQQENDDEYYENQVIIDKRFALFNLLFKKQNLFDYLNTQKSDRCFAGFSIHDNQDRDYWNMAKIFGNKYKDIEWQAYQQENPIEAKCIAAFLGNAIGDALGAHTEFIPFNVMRKEIDQNWTSLKQWAKKQRHQRTTFGLITDDCSMARCMADSLLSNNMQFNPIDMRMRFLLWWHTGYCNGSKSQRSFGLGGNIAEGFNTFFSQNCQPYVVNDPEKDRGQISGNGGIMRLSPIPIAYHDNIKKGEQIAVLQSLTTHNGDEAAELCKMLTHLVIKLINYKGNNPKQDILEKLGETFQTHCESVQYLARSQQEPPENLKNHNSHFNSSTKDRYWNWKDPKIQVSPLRVYQQPGYFGSYAMDGAYVALHIVYHSNSFEEGIFKAVNWGGDADSMAAVVGYISGAMYGITKEMLDLYREEILIHDDYSTMVKAIKLCKKSPIKTKAYYKVEPNEPLI